MFHELGSGYINSNRKTIKQLPVLDCEKQEKTYCLRSIHIIIRLKDKKDENNLTANNEVKLCSELNYEQGLLNHRDKFSKFDLDIKILKERKWKKILIKNTAINMIFKNFFKKLKNFFC